MMLFIDNAKHITDPGDSDDEESLSLCDLPIMTPLNFDRPDLPRERLPPPSPSAELFEFIHDLGAEMCAADDIFLRGQLVPQKYKPRNTPLPTPTTPPLPSPRENHANKGSRKSSSNRRSARHVRSESLDGFERSQRGDGPAIQFWRDRGSFSAEYQKLCKVEERTDASSNQIGSRAGSCEGSVSVPARPKWYMFVFGWMTVPYPNGEVHTGPWWRVVKAAWVCYLRSLAQLSQVRMGLEFLRNPHLKRVRQEDPACTAQHSTSPTTVWYQEATIL